MEISAEFREAVAAKSAEHRRQREADEARQRRLSMLEAQASDDADAARKQLIRKEKMRLQGLIPDLEAIGQAAIRAQIAPDIVIWRDRPNGRLYQERNAKRRGFVGRKIRGVLLEGWKMAAGIFDGPVESYAVDIGYAEANGTFSRKVIFDLSVAIDTEGHIVCVGSDQPWDFRNTGHHILQGTKYMKPNPASLLLLPELPTTGIDADTVRAGMVDFAVRHELID